MSGLRRDLPGSLAHPTRGKRQAAWPIDKALPSRVGAAAAELGLPAEERIRVARAPAFFRAPCVSTLHRELDAKFVETTAVQLELSGLGWGDGTELGLGARCDADDLSQLLILVWCLVLMLE